MACLLLTFLELLKLNILCEEMFLIGQFLNKVTFKSKINQNILKSRRKKIFCIFASVFKKILNF